MSDLDEKQPLVGSSDAQTAKIRHFAFTRSLLLLVTGLCAFIASTYYDELSLLYQNQFAAPGKLPLEKWVAREHKIAYQMILNNIGSSGALVRGAKPGFVIASPSTDEPDYFYTWTRDAALVEKAIIEYSHQSMEKYLRQYVQAQADLQRVNNPSGRFADLTGLGEPKFMADGSAFTGDWGRPQADGPALRATTLVMFARFALAKGLHNYVEYELWPILAHDLDYVYRFWNTTSFDLWEEVRGSSFFTIAAQHRALMEGTELARTLHKPSEHYTQSAKSILCFLQSFWSNKNYIDSNIHHNHKRRGLDANSIIASIHTFDPQVGCDATTFQPCSDKMLANLKAVVDSFRTVYKINAGISANQPIAVGRYAEDVYYDGNPWFLCTLAVAEQLYDSLQVWQSEGQIGITSISLPFFHQFDSTLQKGILDASTDCFRNLTQSIRSWADGFVQIAQTYAAPNGSMSEQFDKVTGKMLSARDLTWSYAAFLTAIRARDGKNTESWGAVNATSDCSSIHLVHFNVKAQTSLGENVYIIGNTPALGQWKVELALPLRTALYTDSNPSWDVYLWLKPSQSFEYKYIRKLANGSVIWQPGPNRNYSSDKQEVRDVW